MIWARMFGVNCIQRIGIEMWWGEIFGSGTHLHTYTTVTNAGKLPNTVSNAIT